MQCLWGDGRVLPELGQIGTHFEPESSDAGMRDSRRFHVPVYFSHQRFRWVGRGWPPKLWATSPSTGTDAPNVTTLCSIATSTATLAALSTTAPVASIFGWLGGQSTPFGAVLWAVSPAPLDCLAIFRRRPPPGPLTHPLCILKIARRHARVSSCWLPLLACSSWLPSLRCNRRNTARLGCVPALRSLTTKCRNRHSNGVDQQNACECGSRPLYSPVSDDRLSHLFHGSSGRTGIKSKLGPDLDVQSSP
jgi:hypothetical protein